MKLTSHATGFRTWWQDIRKAWLPGSEKDGVIPRYSFLLIESALKGEFYIDCYESEQCECEKLNTKERRVERKALVR